MAIHDWTRADASSYHHFHEAWTMAITHALNGGALPGGYFALTDQVVGGPIPDVVTLRSDPEESPDPPGEGAVAVAEAPPKTAIFTEHDHEQIYAMRANRIAIRHRLGQVVAVIEILSPGNKSSQHGFRAFLDKTCALIDQGIHLLLVDLFPPTPRDPQGIHKAIWDEFHEEPFDPPEGKQLTLVAYRSGLTRAAYVEPVAVGDPLSDLPIFLDEQHYVPCPLNETYEASWELCPAPIRRMVER